jgi:hypothetical protein
MFQSRQETAELQEVGTGATHLLLYSQFIARRQVDCSIYTNWVEYRAQEPVTNWKSWDLGRTMFDFAPTLHITFSQSPIREETETEHYFWMQIMYQALFVPRNSEY